MCLDREKPPVIGVCVLSWNSGAVLASCLEHIEVAARAVRSQIVVVDNCSSDDSAALVRRQFSNVAVIESKSNTGYAKGNNVGARYLVSKHCDFLMFVNPDVALSENAIERLVETISRAPKAGCVGGAPIALSGENMFAARTKPTLLEKLVLYGPLHRIRPLGRLCERHLIKPDQLVDSSPVYSVCGACILFRTEAFMEAGGFDEKTFLYEEEMITAERLNAVGWQVISCPTAAYRHAIGHSTARLPLRRRLYLTASEYYLLRRYYKWNPALCGLLRSYRYIEWLGYALVQLLTLIANMPITRQRRVRLLTK